MYVMATQWVCPLTLIIRAFQTSSRISKIFCSEGEKNTGTTLFHQLANGICSGYALWGNGDRNNRFQWESFPKAGQGQLAQVCLLFDL